MQFNNNGELLNTINAILKLSNSSRFIEAITCLIVERKLSDMGWQR